jgi:hypothetical protein
LNLLNTERHGEFQKHIRAKQKRKLSSEKWLYNRSNVLKLHHSKVSAKRNNTNEDKTNNLQSKHIKFEPLGKTLTCLYPFEQRVNAVKLKAINYTKLN